MKQLIIYFLLFAFTNATANTYYISTTGSDAAAGTLAAPWSTLTKVNATTFASGDSILFKCGDTFTGTITATRNGVIYSSYGIGAKPIITGFTTITGWTNEGGGIYSKIIASATQTNMVTIDGVQVAMGRYPDASYITYTAATANTKIVATGLSATNWTNAEAAIRKNDWTIDRCNITNQTVDTITYTSAGSTQNATAGFGFFIQNDLRTLTTYGEWYHNFLTGKFYMYFGAVDPTTKVVKVATVNNLFYITGNTKDNITVNDIAFTGSISHAINIQYGIDNTLISGCNISFAGGSGISTLSTGVSNIYSNNTISNCNGYGIYDYGISTTFTSNSIYNIGTIAGQYLGADGYAGIYTVGDGSNVNLNTVRLTGYNGITLRYTGTSAIQSNIIDSVCTFLDDGAGIYTSTADASVRTITGNTITNVLGLRSAGIYLDENASNVIVSNNNISKVLNFAGIKLHKGASNSILSNTVTNSGYGIGFEDYVGNQIRGNVVKYNTFNTAISWKMRSVTNDLPSFGIADSNAYAGTFYLNQPSMGGWVTYSLAQWKSFSGQDMNSWVYVAPVTSRRIYLRIKRT